MKEALQILSNIQSLSILMIDKITNLIVYYFLLNGLKIIFVRNLELV